MFDAEIAAVQRNHAVDIAMRPPMRKSRLFARQGRGGQTANCAARRVDAGREDVRRRYFEARYDTLDFVADAYRDDVTIEGGVLREECAALYWRPWDEVPDDQKANL